MSPLEAAQAEVDRLKLEAETIPFTTDHDRLINDLAHEIAYYRGLLGLEAVDAMDAGRYAPSHLKTITDLQSRLDALEAAASRTISIAMPEAVSWEGITDRPTDLSEIVPETVEETVAAPGTLVEGRDFERVTRYMVHPTGFNFTPKDAPETVEAARQSAETTKGDDASKTVSFNPMDEDATNGNALRHLLNLDFRTVELAFGFSDNVNTITSPERMAALKAVRDSLKTMKATIERQNETIFYHRKIDTEKTDKIATLLEGQETKSLNVSIDVQELEAVKSTIATLKTEIATRDRLLDDQCQTIGKLERERDEANDKLALVLSRVQGMDLNNPDKMMGQRWVQDTGKNQTQVICTWAGHDVLVSRSMLPQFVARLRETLSWEGKK